MANYASPAVTVDWSLTPLLREAKSRKRGFAGQLPNDLREKLGYNGDNVGALPAIDYPCHVQDQEGRVLLVYLPGFIRDDAELSLKRAVRELDEAPDRQLVTKKEGHWRVHEKYFHPRDASRTIPIGAASYSPCWFTMGHPVRRGRDSPIRPLAEAV
jgi:hypothetical protein